MIEEAIMASRLKFKDDDHTFMQNLQLGSPTESAPPVKTGGCSAAESLCY